MYHLRGPPGDRSPSYHEGGAHRTEHFWSRLPGTTSTVPLADIKRSIPLEPLAIALLGETYRRKKHVATSKTIGIHRCSIIMLKNHRNSWFLSMMVKNPMNSLIWFLSMMVKNPMKSYGFQGCNICSSYRICQNFENLTSISVFQFLKMMILWAFYGPLLVTIGLVAKNCVDRSFSELWKFKEV